MRCSSTTFAVPSAISAILFLILVSQRVQGQLPGDATSDHETHRYEPVFSDAHSNQMPRELLEFEYDRPLLSPAIAPSRSSPRGRSSGRRPPPSDLEPAILEYERNEADDDVLILPAILSDASDDENQGTQARFNQDPSVKSCSKRCFKAYKYCLKSRYRFSRVAISNARGGNTSFLARNNMMCQNTRG